MLKNVVKKVKFFTLLYYVRLLYIGIYKDNTEELNARITFINRLLILYSLNKCVLGIMYFSIGAVYNSYFCFLMLVFIPIIFFINAKRKYLIAKCVIVVCLTFSVLIQTTFFFHPFLSYYYLSIIVSSTLIFNTKETKYLFMINLICAILLVFETTSLSQYLPRMYITKSSEKSNFIILYGNMSFILGNVFLYLFSINAKEKKMMALNKKLKISRIRLEEQSSDHLMFSQASSHFLKSPIYIFNTFIDKIELGLNDDKSLEEMEHYFTVIKQSIDEEEKFINNMFDYNKIILTTPRKKNINLIHLINENLEIFKNNHPNFIYKNDNLDVFIKTDEELLSKIVLIIAENAYFYNINPIKQLEISFELLKNQIKINFKDNGIGISETYRENIFKPYVRINSIEDVHGTGIGLLKAKKAAELINAEFILESSYASNGANFQLILNINNNINMT